MPTPSLSSQDPLQQVFSALREMLKPYEHRLNVVMDQAGNYTAETPLRIDRGQPLMFALIRARTNVAFHFYPVYAFPDLLKDMSPKLAKHMEDKTCWTFKSPKDKLFSELADVVAAGFERYESVGILQRISGTSSHLNP